LTSPSSHKKVTSRPFWAKSWQLTKTSDKPKAQIARALGISDSALYAWCRAAEVHGEEAFPGKGHQLPLEEEIHRLKRELERAQQERDILKCAVVVEVPLPRKSASLGLM
jgi:transposase